jgi:hypothetical protein
MLDFSPRDVGGSGRLLPPSTFHRGETLVTKLIQWFGLLLSIGLIPGAAAGGILPVVIYDGKTTELAAPSPFAQSTDLWVTLPDLTRATGFVLKPQGVCRNELCFPLPKKGRGDFLARRGKVTWFNLSAFARLVGQPVAHDEKLAAWYFGARPDAQNSYLSSLEAPNFTLPDMGGKMHSLADFRGKRVLLITWASW